MSEEIEKAIYRLRFHSFGAGLGNGTCVVNIEDVEKVLAELEKKDAIIDEMARALKEYANLGYLIKCPAEYDGKYNYKYCKIDITKDKTLKTNRLCLNCIIDYFTKKCEGK